MPIVTIIIILVVVGFIMYLIQTAPIPMSPWMRTVIIGVTGIIALIFVLNLFGINTGIPLRLR